MPAEILFWANRIFPCLLKSSNFIQGQFTLNTNVYDDFNLHLNADFIYPNQDFKLSNRRLNLIFKELLLRFLLHRFVWRFYSEEELFEYFNLEMIRIVIKHTWDDPKVNWRAEKTKFLISKIHFLDRIYHFLMNYPTSK